MTPFFKNNVAHYFSRTHLSFLMAICIVIPLFNPLSAIAKENTNAFSAAKLLKNKQIRIILPAYDSHIFYVESAGTLQIQCHWHHTVTITLYDQTGKKQNTMKQSKTNSFPIPKKYFASSSRVFIKCNNHNPQKTSITLNYHINETNNKKIRQSNTISKQKESKQSKKSKHSNMTMPKKLTCNNSKDNMQLSTNTTGKIHLNPHFLIINVNSTHDFSISCGKSTISPDDFLWISSDTSIASVQKKTVRAHCKGTAILYGKHKKNSFKNCSLLVRVIDDHPKNTHHIRKDSLH